MEGGAGRERGERCWTGCGSALHHPNPNAVSEVTVPALPVWSCMAKRPPLSLLCSAPKQTQGYLLLLTPISLHTFHHLGHAVTVLCLSIAASKQHTVECGGD